MSSFICTAKHYNSIESKLHLLACNSQFYWPYEIGQMYPDLANRYTLQTAKEKIITGIIDTIRELNVICVNLQYRHHLTGKLDSQIESDNIEIKQKTSIIALNDIALIKALQCCYYQIELHHLKELRELTEGEKNSMLFVSALINHLALNHINKLESYNIAKWCID